MAIVADVNEIVRAYLIANADIIAFFVPDSPRVYCPRLPENAELPTVSLFVRVGSSSPYIPNIPSPSFQIDCWDDNLIGARLLYRTIYSSLQGIQNQTVGAYKILSAIEEVQGQDLVDTEIPNYFRVLAFFKFIIKAE